MVVTSDICSATRFFNWNSFHTSTESYHHLYALYAIIVLPSRLIHHTKFSSIQVNSQIIRPLEKALMVRLVDIMSSLELRFVQEKADDGQLSYRLDP